ncbi:hypothetical protein BDZ94DRAFT_1180235, partial [Collybia nuda]
ITPDTITVVKLCDIVDSLWMDRTGRRQIRLGKWKHACDVESPEDILISPGSIPFTSDVQKALSPFVKTLKALLSAPENINGNIPARTWLTKSKKNLKSTLIPYVGSLTIIERARIADWFERFISKDKALRQQWMGYLPIAHAHTLFITSRIIEDQRYQDLPLDKVLDKAWEIQLTGVPSIWTDIDVDRDCLARLEEEMFEQSTQAGIAGHCQWGLDAGDHQACWNPYSGTPEHWNHGDREGSDGELEVCRTLVFHCIILYSIAWT